MALLSVERGVFHKAKDMVEMDELWSLLGVLLPLLPPSISNKLT